MTTACFTSTTTSQAVTANVFVYQRHHKPGAIIPMLQEEKLEKEHSLFTEAVSGKRRALSPAGGCSFNLRREQLVSATLTSVKRHETQQADNSDGENLFVSL
ncbi:unnamed protein product [Pleuronectes platessa]|uniref:Uncharacterized protein n=1 Tax=Pleuronectes platessa TaxID=8262 RepID=A0A9N7VFS6_PLEPL|nr:unnamed protein product [Pleuronectes platessa]